MVTAWHEYDTSFSPPRYVVKTSGGQTFSHTSQHCFLPNVVQMANGDEWVFYLIGRSVKQMGWKNLTTGVSGVFTLLNLCNYGIGTDGLRVLLTFFTVDSPGDPSEQYAMIFNTDTKIVEKSRVTIETSTSIAIRNWLATNGPAVSFDDPVFTVRYALTTKLQSYSRYYQRRSCTVHPVTGALGPIIINEHRHAVEPVKTISKAAQAVIGTYATSLAPHGLPVGQVVQFENINGMWQMNGRTANVVAATATTFTIDVDSRTFSAATAGGFARCFPEPEPTWDMR